MTELPGTSCSGSGATLSEEGQRGEKGPAALACWLPLPCVILFQPLLFVCQCPAPGRAPRWEGVTVRVKQNPCPPPDLLGWQPNHLPLKTRQVLLLTVAFRTYQRRGFSRWVFTPILRTGQIPQGQVLPLAREGCTSSSAVVTLLPPCSTPSQGCGAP